jgi:hypothetical protein
MPEGQILEHESGMGLEASEQATEKQQKELEHDVLTLANEVKKINVLNALWGFRYPQEGWTSTG